eukprot:6313232-Alexandrium_andersonii.AAC.1
MSASLVGSEMCIRDSPWGELRKHDLLCVINSPCCDERKAPGASPAGATACLLYTSDAADDM